MNRSITRSLVLALASFAAALSAHAQFTAFNDHFSGPGTHVNATDYNVFGPTSAGALKNIATGASLPVSLTIANTGSTGGTTSGAPDANTPAYNLFTGFVDWGNGSVNHAIQTAAGQSVTRTFSGLDPNKRYRYSGTTVRGNNYLDRWIRIALIDAQAYTAAHTAGCLTNGSSGASVALNEVAINTGHNLAGDMAVWDNIQPSPAGTFTVLCTKYEGGLPGGGTAAGGSYGYSITGEKLEEFNVTPTPAAITNSPSSISVLERAPASFTVGVAGNPQPTLQWYRVGVPHLPIVGATNKTYPIAIAALSDNNASFFAVASNSLTNVSFVVTSAPATLTVIADTVRPTALRAFSGGPTLVQIVFSEPVTAVTATNLANYSVANGDGPLQITNAILAADTTNVLLYTLPQTIGSNYTLTISGIRDRAAAANMLVTTQFTFVALNFAANDIGLPGTPGGLVVVASDALDVIGSGSGIRGTADQFTLVTQQKAGDFDVKVRVAGLTFSDAWSQAALIARETLEVNSVFAAAIATPSQAGSYFGSRATTGAAASVSGNFPANFPDTWLRLRRVGNVFTGFAGPDGLTWLQLGTVTLNVSSVNLGFAVSSFTNGLTARGQFRDYTVVETNAQVVTSLSFASEPLAACSRATQMVFSEVMYKPGALYGTNNIEFVEIYNSNPFFEDISGYRLSGVIDFAFPAGTIIGGNQFIVIAKDPAAVQAYYGITGVMGPYAGTLPAEGTLRLRNEYNGVLLEFDYTDDFPWPIGADGTGHSLVMARPSYGEKDYRSWDVSALRGGSPGRQEPLKFANGLNAVVINEFLANSQPPAVDYLELYNHSAQPVNISGCWLSDAADTNKFQIPTNTILPAGGFIVFYETNVGFALRSAGEVIFLRSPDGQRMLDAVKFDGQETGIAFGRSPDGAVDFYRLQAHTPKTNNAAIRVDDIVINEIMFAPISGDENDQYVELHNKGLNSVSLARWRFASGIEYVFPKTAVISPGGFVVVAKNVTNMLARYSHLNATNTFGNFDGKLAKNGERVAIAKPDYVLTTNGPVITTNTVYVAVDEVSYRPGGRWGKWADEGGSSLELLDPRSNHRMGFNWGDSDESQKAPWTPFEATGRLDHGSTWNATPIDRLEMYMMDEGECLLDDVSITYVNNGVPVGIGIQNAGFETGALTPFTPQGNHIKTTIANSGYSGTKSMHIKSTGGGDAGPNRIRVGLTAALADLQTNVTIRGVARWQRGWPELLMRLKGNYMESYCRMVVPLNLGTPGLPNSRLVTNNAPAIADVKPAPVLPAANEATVISARVHDADGLSTVTLFHRNETTSGSYQSLPMNDNGTGGDAVARDGIYSATILGQSAGTIIAFYVEAKDTFTLASTFPENAVSQTREALLRFGDPSPVSSFATYRMWLTTANINTWTGRPAGSNQDVDGTFVVGNYRVIYNMGAHYGGSPYHQGQNSSPVSGNVHYQASVPADDMYLGTDRFNKLHAPGNGAFDDTSLLREQTAFWLVRKLKLPYLYRRYFAMYVNGTRKGGVNALMEDSQRPGGEMIDEYFPDENVGNMFKIQPWFEWDDVTVTGGTAAGFQNKRWCQLNNFVSTNNAHKLAAYRQTWLARTKANAKNDYSEILALTTVASLPTTSPAYWQNFEGLVDVDHWARNFAVQHAVGNWDSFGNRNAQNVYGYKPTFGKWKQFVWDFNIVLGNSGSDTPSAGNLFQSNGSDPSMVQLNSYPPFRRAWLRAYKQLAVGPDAPMNAANVDPVIDARYNAITANGITPGTAGSTVKAWIASARTAVEGVVTASDAANFSIANTVINTSSNSAIITGTAPVQVTEIWINGKAYPVTWTTVTGWTVTVPVTNNTQVSVAAYDFNGNPVGATTQVTINFAGAVPDPARYVMISEIMYNPLIPNCEYVEIFNSHPTFAFDMSGWVLNGVDYTFPAGSYIAPRSFLLIVKDRTSFANTYGGSLPVFGVYEGSLQSPGERISLIKPGSPDVVINRVRYDSVLPWPVNANGTGSALQLIDVSQENSRVANWAVRYTPPTFTDPISTPAQTNDGWRFVSTTALFGSNNRLLIFPDNAGVVLLDDIYLCLGAVPGTGNNYIKNGDFELPLGAEWQLGTNMTAASSIIGGNVHSGAGAFHIVSTVGGSASVLTRDLLQFISPTPASGAQCTLSFWYWATNNTASNLTVRVVGSSFNVTTNIGVSITPSNYIPPQLVTVAITHASPGASNSAPTNLPAFQTLWINELQADNIQGVQDNFGEREPWIEIYNRGTNSVSLDGLYLSTTYTNLTSYALPLGITMAPGEFKVIWCDNQPAQNSGNHVHTNFRLTGNNGSIALSRLFNGVPQVLDYVNYKNLFPNRSYGSFPDGQPFDRQEFFYVTPGGTNDGASAPLTVFINEWTASSTNLLADPADDDFEDWFELYNPGNTPVDLVDYYLTDSGTNAAGVVTNKFQFRITTNMAHVIPAHGFLLVWADSEPQQNMPDGVLSTDLHVNFSLAKTADAVGLFAADGTKIDYVTFTNQLDDVSRGRYSDGSEIIVPFPDTPSPREPNYLGGDVNNAPVLGLIGNKMLYLGNTLTFDATATDADVPAQLLSFSLDIGAPGNATIAPGGQFSWTPAG
ncbi:MAG TPA: lamin tail domain-containing protein, partial [Candidatus Acidoferrum sp.]|nr:lamin tail domain-containing protein [Candidatus Acidoferrum sp.]